MYEYNFNFPINLFPVSIVAIVMIKLDKSSEPAAETTEDELDLDNSKDKTVTLDRYISTHM